MRYSGCPFKHSSCADARRCIYPGRCPLPGLGSAARDVLSLVLGWLLFAAVVWGFLGGLAWVCWRALA